MTQRERLIELLAPTSLYFEEFVALAEYLLANGVVVLPCRCGECKHHHWEQEPCHGKTVHYCDLPNMRGVEIYKDSFCCLAKRKGGDE